MRPMQASDLGLPTLEFELWEHEWRLTRQIVEAVEDGDSIPSDGLLNAFEVAKHYRKVIYGQQ